MALDISKAPGFFSNWKNSARAPRQVDESKGAPEVVSEKEVDVVLDLSAADYARTIDWLVPGTTLVAKEMAGTGQKGEQLSSRKRKLPEVAVTLHDALGRHVLLKMDRARLCGPTAFKISEEGKRIRLPVRIRGCVPRDRLTQLDEYLFHDVLVSIVANQMDVEEEAARAKGGRKGKGKRQQTVLHVELPDGTDEQLSLT
jgi:hypothetical protein